MAKKPLPTPEDLRQLLTYEPETGKLFWKVRGPERFKADGRNGPERSAAIWNAKYAGKEALSTLNAGGYPAGDVFKTRIQAHRVIWAMVNGSWATGEIDHINGVRTDNRIANLREVTSQENRKNQRMRRANSSGVMGVHFCNRDKKWVAFIGVNGRSVNKGAFRRFDDAVAARRAAEVEYGYHANHGRR